MIKKFITAQNNWVYRRSCSSKTPIMFRHLNLGEGSLLSDFSVFLFILFLLFLGEVPAQAGENIIYDDAAAATGASLANIDLAGTTYSDSFFPGTDITPSAADNTVTVNYTVGGGGSKNPGNVFGGCSRINNGSASGNTVNFINGYLTGGIFGGFDVAPDNSVSVASGNTVNISGGHIDGSIHGGFSLNGSATGNNVIFKSAMTNGAIYGGHVERNYGVASGNTVRVDSGVIGGSIYGGYVYWNEATSNSVNLYGGTISGSIYGGYAEMGNMSTSNSVNLYGGTISGSIYGGYAEFGGKSTSNSVNLYGGTIEGNIYGGYAFQGDGDTTGNTVILSGSPVFLSNVSGLYGGGGSGTGDYFADNVLHVQNPITSGLKEVGNFQYYRFTLPSSAGGEPMLKATDINLTGSGSRIASVDKLSITSGGSVLNVGDKYVLLQSGNTITGVYQTNTLELKQGVSLTYGMEVTLDAASKQLVATVVSTDTNDQANVLGKGRLSGMAAVNQAGELLVGHGISSALSATLSRGHPGTLAAFGVMDGGSSRYKTGSHVDVNCLGLATGVAIQAPLTQNSLVVGVFFEAGWGDYDSYNSFSGLPAVRGSGDTKYYGGGLLGRYDITAGSLAGLYTEASLRGGRTETDFYSSDLTDAAGNRAAYDSSAVYVGAHAGLGYVLNLNDAAALDFSTKYLWTRQGSDNVTVLGDPIHFKVADSKRWRNGARLSYAVDTESGSRLTPYVGAYHDYEFDGKAEATTYGMALIAPELRGGTGMGELGLNFQPAKDGALTLDLAVQGYTGRREGMSGSLQLKFEF